MKNKNSMEAVEDFELLKSKFKNVLIIDDDPCYQDIMEIYAKNFSQNVVKVNCTEKAEPYLQELEFDLIISDYFIPDKDFGTGILKKLREQNKNVPVIMISGDIDNLNPNDYQLYKIKHFLEKPVDVNQLYTLVKEIGE